MGAKLFGQFLLEREAISREMLLEAVKHQKNISLALCTLAVGKGYWTKEQAAQLDDERSRSGQEYRVIAMQHGMLKTSQLKELSEFREERWAILGEALLEKNALTLVQLHGLADEYQQGQKELKLDVPPEKTPIQEWPVVFAFIQETVDLFQHYTMGTVKVHRIQQVNRDSSGIAGDITYVFPQTVKGEKHFCYVLALPEEQVLALASQMLQEKQSEINGLVLDSVAEFVNLIIGHGCIKLNMSTMRITAEPPQVMLRERLGKVLPPQTVTVRLGIDQQEFQVFFFFAGEDGRLPASFI